jgi:Ca-activated chloride channel family protein
MIPILITVVVLVGAIAVVYLSGSRPREEPTPGKRSASSGGKNGRERAVVKKRKSQYAPTPAWLRRLPLVLLVGSVVCLLIGLAQFRIIGDRVDPTIVLVIDTSVSMDATDVLPSRLGAAQTAAETFVDGIPEGIQIGLVSFAGEPTRVVALTTDHAVVQDGIDDPPRGKGTVIGDGLNEALDAVEEAWAAGRADAAIVLLSDGNDTGSQVPPEEAAARAAALGIPVYTVALGATDGEGRGANTDLLEQIATTTGASLATAGTASELNAVYEELSAKLSSQLAVSSTAQFFVILAVVLAMASAVILLYNNRRRD